MKHPVSAARIVAGVLYSWAVVLFLAACDKPDGRPQSSEEEKSTQRSTKSARPADDGHSKPRTGPREALEAALKQPPGEDRETALAAAAWEAIEENPALAGEAMEHLAVDSAPRIRLIQHMAMRLAEKSPDEAVAWAGGLGSENESSAASGRIALVISENDPERAARMLSDSGVAGREFDVAVVQVVQRWAAKDPAAAAAWTALFPAGDFREAGIKAVVSEWIGSDTPAALGWLQRLQDPAIRSEALAAMAEALFQQKEEDRKSRLDQSDPTTRVDLERELERLRRAAGEIDD